MSRIRKDSTRGPPPPPPCPRALSPLSQAAPGLDGAREVADSVFRLSPHTAFPWKLRAPGLFSPSSIAPAEHDDPPLGLLSPIPPRPKTRNRRRRQGLPLQILQDEARHPLLPRWKPLKQAPGVNAGSIPPTT